MPLISGVIPWREGRGTHSHQHPDQGNLPRGGWDRENYTAVKMIEFPEFP